MKIAQGIHSMGQDKGGHVHAYLLDDGHGTHADRHVVRRRRQRGTGGDCGRWGGTPTDLKQIISDPRAQVACGRAGGAEEGQRRDGVGARVGSRHHRRETQGDTGQPRRRSDRSPCCTCNWDWRSAAANTRRATSIARSRRAIASVRSRSSKPRHTPGSSVVLVARAACALRRRRHRNLARAGRRVARPDAR